MRADIAKHQAALLRIAASGRFELRAQGMTDAQIDAAVDEAVRAITLGPSVLPFRRPAPFHHRVEPRLKPRRSAVG